MAKSKCSVNGCEGKYNAKGYCSKHYHRWKSTGDPLRTMTHKEIYGTLEERFSKYIELIPESGCWIWTGCDNGRYGLFPHNGERYAHRVSWILHYGEIEEGKYVCHKCDIETCVNPAHLFIGTAKENHADMVKKGRQVIAVGEQRPASKLTEVDIPIIRKRINQMGWGRYAELGREYGVGEDAIRNIALGISWKHVS